MPVPGSQLLIKPLFVGNTQGWMELNNDIAWVLPFSPFDAFVCLTNLRTLILKSVVLTSTASTVLHYSSMCGKIILPIFCRSRCAFGQISIQ